MNVHVHIDCGFHLNNHSVCIQINPILYKLTQSDVSFVDGMQVVGDNEKLGHTHYTLTIHLK